MQGQSRRDDYVVDENGCWLWQKYLTGKGYGAVNRDGHTWAHRLYYETYVGPIPDGLVIDHLCRVRHCVNPSHMEPVTSRENTLRGRTLKLSDHDVDAIRASGKTPQEIAREYGISSLHAYNVITYRVRANGEPQTSRSRQKLTAEDVATIRRRWEAGGVSQSALAREYGVSSRHLSGIVRGLSWNKR